MYINKFFSQKINERTLIILKRLENWNKQKFQKNLDLDIKSIWMSEKDNTEMSPNEVTTDLNPINIYLNLFQKYDWVTQPPHTPPPRIVLQMMKIIFICNTSSKLMQIM